ncbi:MAG: asparagine synthase (glutamine-hydrolyzing) [Clostridiales bacterium]|nr:asparagine synthase (glutamine-hydrolyzing) [Clostridiales bacterium]
MCGIAGFCSFDRDNREAPWREAAFAMGETLCRRGPDDAGEWYSRDCALAHRRLAVIDPTHGQQPMEKDGLTLCYNGELYNTPELRYRLMAAGHTFATRTDTEVVLEAYRAYGEGVGDYLEGIYAFALWDSRAGRLFCCRDRFGVKPFFYTVRDGAFVFGSELKALFAYPGIRPEADEDTWREVLGVSPARTPGSGVFAGIRELRPAHQLVFDREGLRMRRYWNVESRPHTESYEDTVAHLRTLLTGAIRRQLVSDVPLATLLSGGLDSSIITAVAAAEYAGQGREPLATYSFDYTGNDRFFRPSSFQPDADAPWALRMAEDFRTRHTVLTCTQEALVELLPAAVEAKDLPGMADLDSSLLFFCGEIKKQHTVTLSGECSDELFGGYPWFHRADMMAADTFPWCMDFSARTEVLNPALVQRLDLEESVRARYHASLAETPRLEGETGAEARRREIAWLNLIWFMTNLLDRKDRMSMYSGLEVRVPFCDRQVVEYVWNIPWEMKSRGGVRKAVLRDAAASILPEAVRLRPKSPYPKTHNPRFEALAREKLLALLADPNAPIHAIVNEDALRGGLLVSAGDYGRPWFGQLMAGPQMIAWLIELNLWMERFGVAL